MNRKDFDKAFEVVLKKYLGSGSNSLETVQHCPDENIITAYMEGQLPAEVKASFEKHASRCSRCQEELAVLLQTGMVMVGSPGEKRRSIWSESMISCTLRP